MEQVYVSRLDSTRRRCETCGQLPPVVATYVSVLIGQLHDLAARVDGAIGHHRCEPPQRSTAAAFCTIASMNCGHSSRGKS